MMHIAIVEDEASYRSELGRYLKQYENENNEIFHISEFGDGDGILHTYEKGSASYDMILMDIEMPFVDGMRAAKEIREVDEDVIIIFITNTPQYAMTGYMVGALDYILKPVSYYAFSQTIMRAMKRKKALSRKSLLINIKGGIKKIALSQITYIEVFDHDLIIHTVQEDIETKGSMRDMEKQLKEEYFFQCNKGYLINLAFVESISGMDVQVGKEVLAVSRSKKKALIEAFHAFITKRG